MNFQRIELMTPAKMADYERTAARAHLVRDARAASAEARELARLPRTRHRLPWFYGRFHITSVIHAPLKKGEVR